MSPPSPPGTRLSRRSIPPVHRHHTRPAEPQIVLEAHLGALDLALVRLAAELPHELGALGQARGAEGVPLGQEAARGVDHELAAIAVVAVPDELLGLTLLAEPDRLVGDDLVDGEAVVELD